jgi:protein-disulfide isomerase
MSVGLALVAKEQLMRNAFFSLMLLTAGMLGAGAARAEDSGACVAGPAAAPIKIEVFSDYQCPACKAFYLNTMRMVFPEYADQGKVCVVYREFPLQMHEHARLAARYGHAAKKVGLRQWGLVTDALFLNQDTWGSSGDVESVVAKALSKADLDAVHNHLKDIAALDAAIDADVNLGLTKGVNSTPTFWVTTTKGTNQKLASAVQYPILKRYLDNLIAEGR